MRLLKAKISPLKGPMHVKFVMAQSPAISMVGKFGEWCASSDAVLVTEPVVQNYQVLHQQSSSCYVVRF
ncbi:hypothetical protein TNCV_2263891 [Trichonephila clavipes]|nr:hypothetical protein TNCV_2263891 [Trichonephila clavipes]